MLKVLFLIALATTSTLATPGAVDPCVPVPTGDWAKMRACLSTQIGTARPVPNVKGMAVPGHGSCPLGYHKLDNWCHPNTAYCSDQKYDAQTFNCTSCKWYAFQVAGDLTHFPYFTGDYCRTRWWWFVLLLFLLATALMLFFALLRYFFCRPKPKTEKKPLVEKRHEVEVEAERDYHVREERGEAREWRDEPVTREHRHDPTYGQRVHVETRTYSPNRDVQRVTDDKQDWARWSHANWQEH